MKPRRRRTAGSSTRPISFRLATAESDLLTKLAAEMNLSPHVLARLYVTEALNTHCSLQALAELLKQQQTELRRLRLELSQCALALLMHAGKATAQDAKDWIRQVFQLS